MSLWVVAPEFNMYSQARHTPINTKNILAMGDIEITYPPYNLVELYGLKHMRDKQEEKA